MLDEVHVDQQAVGHARWRCTLEHVPASMPVTARRHRLPGAVGRNALVIATAIAGFAACRGAPSTPRAARAAVPANRAFVHGTLLVVESHDRTGIGINARLHNELVVLERADLAAPSIAFLVYERDGERRGYGVYGLGGAKNPMQVPRPLLGESITWPDKDHAAGLVHVLARTVGAPEAETLVQRHGERWFRDGLRVFLVVPGSPPDVTLLDGSLVEGARQTTASLRVVEFAAPPAPHERQRTRVN